MGLADDHRVLTTSHAWSATPADYSSLRFLMLRPDGTGEMVSGYGQTIHAHIHCRWELLPANRLAVTCLESPPKRAGAFFQGYCPAADLPARVLEYRLTEGAVTGRCCLTGRPFEYRWTLELEAPPWPEDVRLPPGQPRVFYGHAVKQGSPPASQGG